MLKKNKIIFAGILLIISLMSFALAGNRETIYFQDKSGNPLTNVRYLVYECADANCNFVVQKVFDLNSGSKNYVSYEYPSTAFKYYASYIFKGCYLAWEDTYTNEGDGWVSEWTYKIGKKDVCSSEINSFSVTNTNYANEPVVINMQANLDATTRSAFSSPSTPPYWYPYSGFEDYYSAETRVTLEIRDSNNNVVHTATRNLNLKIDSSENVQFTWTPTTEGTYTAQITTTVTDCQCASSVPKTTSKTFNVFAARPTDECYTILNNLNAVQGTNFVTIDFDKISNYADIIHAKTPVPTRIVYEIKDSSGNIVYSNNILVSANSDTTNPQNIELNWTPVQSGDYDLRVTGVAESSLCAGKTNPQDTISLGFWTTLPPIIAQNYTITFNVRDLLDNAVSGATVNLNGITALTDSSGLAQIIINSGNYHWIVSKSGYQTSNGTISVNANQTIDVSLLLAPVCGNNITETSEQCDDGNLINHDGCSDACQNENYNPAWCGDGILFLGHEECDDGNILDSDGCSSTCEIEYAQCVVDSDCPVGQICVSGFCQPTYVCGNGVLELGEQCDLGIFNGLNNSGCSATCTLVVIPTPCPQGLTLCSDGICSLNCSSTDGGTICDHDGTCDSNEGCTCDDCNSKQDSCATGLICSFVDGACCNNVSDGICYPGCSNMDPDCAIPVCGNGIVEIGEFCDDGIHNGQYGYCSANCNYLGPHCGDGILDLLFEECDDGNILNGDGCSSVCEWESNGGGSSTISYSKEKCTSNWACSGWSECFNGVQTRECVDLNRCSISLNTPLEIRACISGGGSTLSLTSLVPGEKSLGKKILGAITLKNLPWILFFVILLILLIILIRVIFG